MAPLIGAAASLTMNAITLAMASGSTAPASMSGGNSILCFRRDDVPSNGVDSDAARAELDIEGTHQHQGGLRNTASDEAGGLLNTRPCGHVDITPEHLCCMYCTTACVNYGAAPRFTPINSLSFFGVTVSESPGSKAPMVFYQDQDIGRSDSGGDSLDERCWCAWVSAVRHLAANPFPKLSTAITVIPAACSAARWIRDCLSKQRYARGAGGRSTRSTRNPAFSRATF